MKQVVVLCAALIGGIDFASHGATGYSTPVDPATIELSPYVFTGFVDTPDGHGSGSVAVHPRLVLGAAHVNFDNLSTWLPAGSIQWFWKWNESGYPPDGGGLYLTGYYYFSNYSSNAIRYGGSDPRTYQLDFVVNYSVTQDAAGGLAADWVEDGKKLLTSGKRSKRITGYPSGIYKGLPDHPFKYKMHEMSFNKDLSSKSDNYLQADGIETGKGNSGGPAWVWDSNKWVLAGVTVSGLNFIFDTRSTVGICSLNKASWNLILSALQKTGGAESLYKKISLLENVPTAIPDQSAIGRTFQVGQLLGGIQGVKLNLLVNHPRQGDLIVTLRSPTGKTVTLLSAVAKNKASPRNLVFANKTVSGFSGLSANGTWTLTVKDAYRSDTGSIQSGSLEITTK